MDALRDDIERYFGSTPMPTTGELVEWNGLDELDKSAAVKAFAGKPWNVLYEYLANGDTEWSSSVRLEEWSCLSPRALRYYSRPYLLYLLDTLVDENPDDQFVASLFFELHQAIRVNGGDIFDNSQKVVLKRAAQVVSETVSTGDKFAIWRKDIATNVNQFLSSLGTEHAG